MNRIKQIAQTIEDCGYSDYTDLDPDWQAEEGDAWGKFKHWSRLFLKDIAGKGDAMEIEIKTETDADGNPVSETKQFGNRTVPPVSASNRLNSPTERLTPEVTYES